MWSVREKLEQGEAVVVYGRPLRELLAAVITAERTWYVPLGELAPIKAALAEFRMPRVGVPVLVDELRARLVDALGLGNEIERVFVVPVKPFIDLPWVLLLGDREVVLGREASRVTAFGDWVPAFGNREEGAHGEEVLAVGRSRRVGNTAAEQEARAVGDSVLVGDQATWEAVEEVAEVRPHWRALHIACPRSVAEQWSRRHPGLGELGKFRTRRRAWLGDPEPELVVLSVDESLRVLWKPESARGPHVHAPRTILSLWEVDAEATRVLMRRFYDLWNGKVSLPACTALKLAQDFVRSQPAWKHPYYWAGWQLWASRDQAPRKGGS
jgi:co-chaperonin GroES (HSP10)